MEILKILIKNGVNLLNLSDLLQRMDNKYLQWIPELDLLMDADATFDRNILSELCIKLEEEADKEFILKVESYLSNPRSLKRLCRQTVKVILGHGRHNKAKIDSLPLPKTNRMYLQFENIK